MTALGVALMAADVAILVVLIVIRMRNDRQDFLRCYNLATLAALPAVGESSSDTGGCLARDDFGFCVSAINCSDLTADVAISIRSTVICVRHFSNRPLRHGDGIAYRAVFSLRETHCSAGGSLCRIKHLFMSELFKLFGFQNRSAIFADAIANALCGTGGFCDNAPLGATVLALA